MSQVTIPKIKVFGIVFQNNQGARFYSKYFLNHFSTSFKAKSQYNFLDLISQRKFQSELLKKAKKMNVISTMKPDQTQIFTYQSFTVLFKVFNELQVYLICDDEQNNILMQNVIQCLGNVLNLISKQPYKGKIIYDHIQQMVLAIDQIIDEGLLVTLDSNVVYQRVKMKQNKEGSSSTNNQPAQQQQGGGGFSSLFGFAKNSLAKTLNFS